jgi:DNA-binding CsgD family transcriptional regulator
MIPESRRPNEPGDREPRSLPSFAGTHDDGVPSKENVERQLSFNELLEREEALSALSRVGEAARAGRGRTLFVEAEAGLGKTELLRRAHTEGSWSAIGRSAGSRMERGLAFSYLGQAMETLGFADLTTGAPGSSGTDLRVRLFLAVRDWLIEQSAAGPVLLALDDLHWADEDSLALLSFLCRRLTRAKVAIVATLRPWPDGAATLAADLTGSGTVELQILAPLSDEAARALYLANAPEGRDGAQADVVVRLASGNPLLVGEAARAAGPVAELSAEATPQVRNAMRQALLLSSFSALGEEARSCAQAGAVLGSPIRLGLVEEVSGLDRAATDAGIETLFAAGLLHVAGPGRATFRHDLVAEALYGDLDEGRRRRLHERAWRTLANRGELALATAHALPADLMGVPEAVQLAHRAGSEAFHSGAVSSAVQLLKVAEALGSPSADTDVVGDLAETLLSAGHPAEAAAACERALSVGASEARVRLRMLGLFGRAALLCGDQTRSAAATEEALVLAADKDPEAFVAFSVDEVYRMTTFIGPAQAQPRLEEFHRRALALGASSVGILSGLRAFLAIGTGQSWDLAPLEQAAEAVVDTPRASDPSAFWDPVAHFVAASVWMEDFEAGERWYQSLAERVGAKEPIVSDTAVAFSYAGGLLRQGRLSEAETVMAHTAHSAEAVSFGTGFELQAHCILALEAGRSEEAATLASTGQAAADASGRWYMSCWAAHIKGSAYLALGRVDEAADAYRSLGQLASEVGLGHPSVVPWAGAGLAAFYRSGARDEVASLVNWLESALVGAPCRWPRAMAAFGRGLLGEDAGDHTVADRAFEEALGLLRSVRLPLELGRVALAYSAVLRRRGERRRARTVAAEAAELAATSGSVLLAEQARGELARLGARRSRGRSEGLTKAEAKVAAAAAGGASNAEIAASLVVSVRTVEAHLSRVYTKLGLRSRRELMIRFPDGTGLSAVSDEGARP